MSCAHNLCIRKIVERRKLEKKENEKTHVGRARGQAAQSLQATTRRFGFVQKILSLFCIPTVHYGRQNIYRAPTNAR
jgi:hypothetical protein